MGHVQGISKRPFPGLVNFVPAVAYLFCLNLPAAFWQPGNGLLEIPCTCAVYKIFVVFTELGTRFFCPTWYNSLFLQSATSNEQPRGNEEAPLHRGQIWREAARASADATTAIFYIDLELVSFSSSSLSPCSPSSRISPRQSRNPRSLKWFRGPPPSQEPQIEANT